MGQTRTNIAAPMPTRRAFIAHCHAQGLGVSAGMKLAVEWRQLQLGKPMPRDPSDFTTTRGGVDSPLPLSELRRRLSCGEQVDLFAHGGCGCFIDAEEAA